MTFDELRNSKTVKVGSGVILIAASMWGVVKGIRLDEPLRYFGCGVFFIFTTYKNLTRKK